VRPEALAEKKLDQTINLNCLCDMGNCLRPVQIVLILDNEEWQLCTVCYDQYLQAVADLQKRNAVEPCVEPTEGGQVPLPKTNSSDNTCPWCHGHGVLPTNDFNIEKCQRCNGTGHVFKFIR